MNVIIRPARLVRDSFDTASPSLYASLGFEVREPPALLNLAAVAAREIPGGRKDDAA